MMDARFKRQVQAWRTLLHGYPLELTYERSRDVFGCPSTALRWLTELRSPGIMFRMEATSHDPWFRMVVPLTQDQCALIMAWWNEAARGYTFDETWDLDAYRRVPSALQIAWDDCQISGLALPSDPRWHRSP